jgi:hypothetical protein
VEKVCAQGTPAGVAAAVVEAISHEKLFVFGELLELPAVKALAGDTEHGAAYELLKLFAYGTWASASAAGHALTSAQASKLKLLTIVTLASTTKVIQYADLQRELQISSIRGLEDTVIESIYQGLVVGKLDPKHNRLDVLSAIGRDVSPDNIWRMQQRLAEWCATYSHLCTVTRALVQGAKPYPNVHRRGGASRSVMEAIEQKTQYANDQALAEVQHQAAVAQRIEEVKALLKVADVEGGRSAKANRTAA